MPPPTPSPSAAERDLRAALLSLAARLRSQGAGRAALRSALEDEAADYPVPPLDSAAIAALAASMASLPPEAAVGAVADLLRSRGIVSPPGLIIPDPSEEEPGENPLIPFPTHTAASLARDTPAAVDWISQPWAAAGALTAITGRPKIGKTTFVLDLVRAVLAGAPFLGRPTRATATVYLTEQQPSSFRASLARAGLLAAESLTLVFWHEAISVPWPRAIAAAIALCRARKARLLIVDTLSQWAGLRGDMENQAGDAFAALQPLQRAAAEDISVVFLQHERKSGGDPADAGRGSSAFAGAVDTLVSFRRPGFFTGTRPKALPSPLAQRAAEGDGLRAVAAPVTNAEGDGLRAVAAPSPSLRLLLALSRFEAVPPQLYVERLAGSYTVVGDTPGFVTRGAEQTILAALVAAGNAEPGDASGALSLNDVMQTTSLSRPVVTRAVNSLFCAGRICRLGGGSRGDPYRYRAADSFFPL